MDDLNIDEIVKYISKSPAEGVDIFARWAYFTLYNSHINEFKNMDISQKEDIIEEIIIHCITDNYKVLKKYKKNGGSFVGWFYRVTKNKIIDILRRPENKYIKVEFEDYMVEPNSIAEDKNDLVDVVWDSIKKLKEKCQILLKLAADEYTPLEMTIVLGMPKKLNQKVADDLRYCRKKLKELILSEGVSLSELF